MPKRKITAKRAAQIVKWQTAGALARRKPHGKLVTVYHGTGSFAADEIVRTQFLRGRGSGIVSREKRRADWGPRWPVYVRRKLKDMPYGHAARGKPAVVSVRVPFRKLGLADPGHHNGDFVIGEEVLRGRKIRRVF